MIKIGIIAGGGQLPLLVGKNLKKNNFDITFFIINEFFDEKKYKKFNTVKINLNSLKLIIKVLKKNRIENIIMLGKVNRPSFKDLKFDIDTISFIKKYLLEKKGDNKLLISIQEYFFKKGFPYFDWTQYCKELFANKINLTRKIPSKNANLNMTKGVEAFKFLGKTDIGQSIVIQNEFILGLEAAEGTDELIKRCSKYKKKGDKGVLVKLCKYNQSHILDIPTVGLNTMKLLKKYNYEGIYLEQNRCLILDKDKVIKYADSNNIFIATINKID